MRLKRVSTSEDDWLADGDTLAIADDEGDDPFVSPAGREMPADEVLALNRVPAALAEQLLLAADPVAEDEDPARSLARGLASCLSFTPLRTLSRRRAIALIGPPGAGKTTLAAKLAASARTSRMTIVDADAMRDGAPDQLAECAALLGVGLRSLESPEELADLRGADRERIIIDTPGLNPYDGDALRHRAALVRAARAEPVLVLPANIEPEAAAAMVAALGALPIRRLLVTRLDMVRRLGGLLAAAAAGRYELVGASVTPHVSYGLCPITPSILARRLVSAALLGERWRTQ